MLSICDCRSSAKPLGFALGRNQQFRASVLFQSPFPSLLPSLFCSVAFPNSMSHVNWPGRWGGGGRPAFPPPQKTPGRVPPPPGLSMAPPSMLPPFSGYAGRGMRQQSLPQPQPPVDLSHWPPPNTQALPLWPPGPTASLPTGEAATWGDLGFPQVCLPPSGRRPASRSEMPSATSGPTAGSQQRRP